MAHALGGLISSVLAEVVLFPLDTVKLLTQTADIGSASSFMPVLGKVLKEKGLPGLYKGLGASVFKESVHSFNYWVWQGLLFQKFGQGVSTTTARRLLLNLLAKQLNWLCTVPFEVVSSINQLSPQNLGFCATAVSIYREGGIGTFYRGLAVSLVLAINPAIMHTLITNLLKAHSSVKVMLGIESSQSRIHGPSEVGAVTALSKIIATLATYPLIRAKVLQQTGAVTQNAPVFKVWRQILSEEGILGLYRGVLAMSYKTVLWNAFMMMIRSVLVPGRTVDPSPPPTPVAHPLVITHMGRDPFLDPITSEKLDEILRYIQGSDGTVARRVGAVEQRIDTLSSDMQEIKGLLHQILRSQPEASTSRDNSPDSEASPVAGVKSLER